MYDGPGFVKPTHGYGEPLESERDGRTVTSGEVAEVMDTVWAGKGFTKTYEEPGCGETADQQA